MKAKVIKANYQRELYIFEREDGEYGYFEVLDSIDLEPDDILSGDFSDIGDRLVKNLQTGAKIRICIEDFCSLELAMEMIN